MFARELLQFTNAAVAMAHMSTQFPSFLLMRRLTKIKINYYK